MNSIDLVEGLVSVVLPVHNRPKMLAEAIQSVLHQTYRNFEIIVVDDGSTDNTPNVAGEFARTHPKAIKVWRQENAGPGVARENGRRLARGEFIQYLDSDDLLLPDKLERHVNGFKDNPDCGVSYGMTRIYNIGEAWDNKPGRRTGEKLDKMFPTFLAERGWTTVTPLYRKTVSDSAGPWEPLWQEEDWEYDCRIAALDTKLHFVPEYIAEHRGHEGPRLQIISKERTDFLRDRGKAHMLIYSHALRSGITPDIPEMRRFARTLFLLARQCGAGGFSTESAELFRLAREASGPKRANGWDFRIYGLFGRLAGWRQAGRISAILDTQRKRK